MNPVFLAAFFTAAIVGCTAAFAKISVASLQFPEWLGLFVIFVLYRSKIMVDDLGWYADLKVAGDQPNPVDVLFAVITWIGWFMMAATMGESLRYFVGLWIATFLVSTVWIYVADLTARNLTREKTKSWLRLGLKSTRHGKWCWMNLLVMASAVLCYAGTSGWLPAVSFWWGLSGIYAVFVADVLINLSDFRNALQKAN